MLLGCISLKLILQIDRQVYTW